MNEPFKSLINALRGELQHYGEMLARLDQQQDCIMRRAADELMASVTAVQAQTAAIQQARESREAIRRQVAREMGQPEDANLTHLTAAMPADYRPLMKALVEENNALLVRVQQRARQNHLLLSRSLTMMQDLLQVLQPASQRTLYDGHGNSFNRAMPAFALCDAAG